MSPEAELPPKSPDQLWSELVDKLIAEGALVTREIIGAFRRKSRHLLFPHLGVEAHRILAGTDAAFPIGFEATISQPNIVATMTEAAEPKEGEVALDIGCGCGHQTMVLKGCVGESGKVYGVEFVPQLVSWCRHNMNKLEIQAEILLGDATIPEDVPDGPFDIITSAAACERPPLFWLDRLSRNGGRAVFPMDIGCVENEKFIFYDPERGEMPAPGNPNGPAQCLRKLSAVEILSKCCNQMKSYSSCA